MTPGKVQTKFELAVIDSFARIQEDWAFLQHTWDDNVVKRLHVTTHQLYNLCRIHQHTQLTLAARSLEISLYQVMQRGTLPTKLQSEDIAGNLGALKQFAESFAVKQKQGFNPVIPDNKPPFKTDNSFPLTAPDNVQTTLQAARAKLEQLRQQRETSPGEPLNQTSTGSPAQSSASSLPDLKISPPETSEAWLEFAESFNSFDSTYIGELARQLKTSPAPGAGGLVDIHHDTAFEYNRPLVLLEANASRTSELSYQLSCFGYDLISFDSVEHLLRFVDDQEPAAVIVARDLSKSEKLFFQTFQAARSKFLPLVFISEQDDVNARLEAIKTGGDAYFTQPVDIRELIDKLDKFTSPVLPAPYRILVVDDSPTATMFVSTTLQGAGMLTVIVTEPLQIMKPLVEFIPDLILMDLYLENLTGLELAKMIRQQDAYSHIPIVFLSAETDLEIHMQALREGSDDFLTKPIHRSHLISLVEARAANARRAKAKMQQDSLTGLFNHTSLKEQLSLEAARAHRRKQPLCFAMLDLDRFKLINDTYGHPAGDTVLKNLSRLLKQRLRRTDVIGRYGGEEFAVILPDTSLANSCLLLDSIRNIFSRLTHTSGGNRFNAGFSVGIASFEDWNSDLALTQAADQALYAAKRLGRNQVVVARPSSKSSEQPVIFTPVPTAIAAKA